MSGNVPAPPGHRAGHRADKRTELLDSAERDFEREGFRGLSVARLLRDNRISTRTFYKHFESKDRLVVEVLERRHARYLDALDASVDAATEPVDALFDSLRDWMDGYGTGGCLYLRALGEYGDADREIAGCARDYKRALRARVHECVRASLGRPDPALGDRVWLLFEGATAVAGVAGPGAVDAAAGAARALLAAARAHRTA